jgi:osmotically-inducible protein OsmY
MTLLRAWSLALRRGGPLALALALAACPAQVRSNDPVARDQEIKRDILWRFRDDPMLADVTVDCRDGIVTLAGRVPAKESADRAETVASGIRSVRGVVNRIEVRPK